MMVFLANLLIPVVVLALVVFLLFRLRLFSTPDLQGKYVFVAGGLILFLASAWQWARLAPEYDDWFIITAYPVIDAVQFVLLALGALLVASGVSLYADFWQIRKEDIESREAKLNVLDNLLRDAREPYQLMELVNIALKEILLTVPGSAGAVFLINRKRRQFVLTSYAGLDKQEIAHLEYYPLDRNIVNQAVELGDPLIASEFMFVDREGKMVASRFHSTLVLPMLSGMERIGGILLFSVEEKFFHRSDVRFLSPVAEWLAEKIKSARLTRELTLMKSESERLASRESELTGRLVSTAEAFDSRDAVTSFCRGLIGLADCRSVHLIGLKYGSLHFYGGSEPLFDLSENYRTALVDAVDRKKPLIVNQEVSGENGRSQVALSSLIFPLRRAGSHDALLFRRESSAFRLDDTELKTVEVFSHLARVLLSRDASERLVMSRRIGFEKVLDLLPADSRSSFDDDPGFFVRHLSDILPDKSVALTFVPGDDGRFGVAAAFNVDQVHTSEFEVGPGEGGVGQSSAAAESLFFVGRTGIKAHIESYDQSNRDLFVRLFGERGYPSFLAYCPVTHLDRVAGVAVILMYNIDESENGEWERLLTLAVGLYSLRLSINGLRASTTAEEILEAGESSPAINQINNCLSAVMGSAELVTRQPNLPPDVRQSLNTIVSEAEKAARLVQAAITETIPSEDTGATSAKVEAEDLNGIIRKSLDQAHISGDLYMTGGRPREINLNLQPTGSVLFGDEDIRRLFESAVNRFSAVAADEDAITVATYQQGDFVYLDISRHRRNFPPVKTVADFGEYAPARKALEERPSDVFLRHITEGSGWCAVDRTGASPAYLSFKFPVRSEAAVVTGTSVSGGAFRILAVDDEAIILDLISAMCQSLGHEVVTAKSGEEALKLLDNSSFSLVLTDLSMPGISGLEVAQEVTRRMAGTPIILLTGWDANISPDAFREAGIIDILYKPFRIEQLTEAIQAVALAGK